MQCSKKGEKKNGKCIRKREKIFQVIIHIFLILLALCAVLPIWILVAGSITGEQELILSGYSFIPKTLSLDAYKYLFYKGADILRAYGITIFITIFGTAVSLLMTPLLAYPLSRKDFKARNIFAFLVFLRCCLMVVSYRLTSCGRRFFIWKIQSGHWLYQVFWWMDLMYSDEELLCTEYSAGTDWSNESGWSRKFCIFFKMVLPLSLRLWQP